MNNYAVTVKERMAEDKRIRIYPNPFHQFTLITFENSLNISHTLKLYNATGQLLRTISDIRSDEIKLERGALSRGMYYIQLISEGNISTRKLMIE